MDRIIADRLYELINVMNKNNKLLEELVQSNKKIERVLNDIESRRK